MKLSRFKTPMYIVGGGSFATKLAAVFKHHKLAFTFVDELSNSVLLDIPVLKAKQADPRGIFFIAISIPKYVNSAIARLTTEGIKRGQCLPLMFDSDCRMFEHMLTIDRATMLTQFTQVLSTFDVFEALFFVKRETFLQKTKQVKEMNIGFCCIGRGGGYLDHLGQLPQKISAHYKTTILSDSIIDNTNFNHIFLMGQSAMLSNDCLDLVITSHVFPCSPKHIKKLSLSHMVYDFLLYDEQTIHHLSQADTHYIFVPSSANMRMHQDLCIKHKLMNNIVLIPGGYPKHDKNIQTYQRYRKAHPLADCILYAPTLSSLPAGNESDSCFSIIDALDFIPRILSEFTDKTLIFRPHPEDLALAEFELKHPRAQAFVRLLKWCEFHPRCEIDTNKNHYLASFARSVAIITDTSSVGFSFGLITGRPSIFYSSDHDALKNDFTNSAFILDRDKFGILTSSVETMIASLHKAFIGEYEGMTNQSFCQSVIYNVGSSEDYLLDNLHYITQDKKHPDWWYLVDNCGVMSSE